MIKKFTVALSLLLCVPCVSIEAKTVGSFVWDGGKTLFGAFLIWRGGKAVINACSAKKRKEMKKDFKRAAAEGREEVRRQGGNLQQYDAMVENMEKVMHSMPVIMGVVGGAATIIGALLGYRGLIGLCASENQAGSQ